ncbi:MAG: hypothetical protein V3U74_02170 [Thermodesulfobacteriota bacterium]
MPWEPNASIQLVLMFGSTAALKEPTHTEEGAEAVRDVLSKKPFLNGFYSYGETSPFSPGANCIARL